MNYRRRDHLAVPSPYGDGVLICGGYNKKTSRFHLFTENNEHQCEQFSFHSKSSTSIWYRIRHQRVPPIDRSGRVRGFTRAQPAYTSFDFGDFKGVLGSFFAFTNFVWPSLVKNCKSDERGHA